MDTLNADTADIKDWNAGNTPDRSFDFLCEGYDDILEPRA